MCNKHFLIEFFLHLLCKPSIINLHIYLFICYQLSTDLIFLSQRSLKSEYSVKLVRNAVLILELK